jgi:hypothetical protein
LTTPRRFNPPPPPSTPKQAPWTDAEGMLDGLNRVGAALALTHSDFQALLAAIQALSVGGGIPPESSLYGLYMYEDVGTVSEGGARTNLTDNKKVWEINMWRGHTLFVLIGTVLYVTPITSSAASALTFPQLPVTIPGSAPYWITSGVSGSLSAKTAIQVLSIPVIIAAATSVLADCAAIDLTGGQSSLALTIGCTYNAAAVAGIRIHVRTSFDGVTYDTVDWDTWTPGFVAGATIQQTKVYDVSPAYLKILVENLDLAQTVTLVTAESTVRGG